MRLISNTIFLPLNYIAKNPREYEKSESTILIKNLFLDILMSDCTCGVGGDSDEHYDRIRDIDSEIQRLRYSESHTNVKSEVISLYSAKIEITNCLGGDTTQIEEILEEYQNAPGIKYSTQWSSSTSWDGSSHGVNKR